ncbi:MAG: hypothetical protein Q9218_004707 [Villophora microphyllina]
MAMTQEMMAGMAQAIPQLGKIPLCAYPAFGAIAAAGCGMDLKCICANDKFYTTIQGVLLLGTCSPLEAQSMLSSRIQLLESDR